VRDPHTPVLDLQPRVDVATLFGGEGPPPRSDKRQIRFMHRAGVELLREVARRVGCSGEEKRACRALACKGVRMVGTGRMGMLRNTLLALCGDKGMSCI